MKTLENRLRSWRPRRPSTQLERRLFGRDGHEDPGVQALVRWLTPLAACLILVVAALNHPATTGGRVTESSEWLGVSLSNQHYAAYLPGSFQCEANRLDTFGWTNGGRFPSSTLSIPEARLNY